MFLCESKSALFRLLIEDTIKIQWLGFIYNTVPENYKLNILVGAADFAKDFTV